MRYASIVLVAMGWISLSSNLFAEEPSGFRRSLFDGETLNGWTIENDCDVDVIDGCIRLKSGHGWLRSDHRLRDFELHLEWKALKSSNYDAGIYIRSSLEGKPFPKNGYQVNLLEGKEGNIGNLPGAASRGLAKPAGEWNVFDLRVEGEKVQLKMNGELAWTTTGLTLMDDQCWSVINSVLTCSGKKGPWLRSKSEYDDFNLRLEYRVAKSGNSGVYVRVPPDGNHHRDNDTQPAAGFEVQILDDTAPEHAALKDFQYSASIYDFAGAKPKVSRPLGEWNSLEINCLGQQITTWHNGRGASQSSTGNSRKSGPTDRSEMKSLERGKTSAKTVRLSLQKKSFECCSPG